MEFLGFEKLMKVIDSILDPESGCDWDKEQTPTSLCEYLIEETHELVSAIRHSSIKEISDEMGDVIFVLAFLAYHYRNQGLSLDKAMELASEKMIRRHPHVFSGKTFASREEHHEEWEKIKKDEKSTVESVENVLYGIPKSLPTLVRAYRIHAKASRLGFTWDNEEDVEQQIESEWLELIDALQGDDKEHIAHELGDMIFVLVELGRRRGIKANEALDFANQRIIERMVRMEKRVVADGKTWDSVSMEEKNMLWEEVKKDEKN